MVEQLPSIFGIATGERVVESTFLTMVKYLTAIRNAHIPTMLVGLSSLALLIFHKFWIKGVKNPYIKKVPIILVIVSISIILSATLKFSNFGIKVLGDFNNTLPTPTAPELHLERLIRMIPDAIIITVVGFIESQTVTRTFGLKNNYFPDSNKELFALGIFLIKLTL